MANRFYGTGYCTFCQRGQCSLCKHPKCECPARSGGVADQELVQHCRENAVLRGYLGPRCQQDMHGSCKIKSCRCKCHANLEVVVTEKVEVPVASEEHVLELQERIYAAEASFIDSKHDFIETAADYATQIHTSQQAAEASISEFDTRLANMEALKRLEIKIPGKAKPIDVGVQHEAFPKLVEYASIGLNVFMRGPAGSGKTSAGAALAQALGRPFSVVPLGPQTSKSDLMGYMNGAGNYVPSLLRTGYETGHVVLLDEIDAANPAVLTIINGLLANGHGGFPDKMVGRHPKCLFISAGNTYGRGADSMYVGRAQLDAATLDRWVMLNWDYDWSFAATLCGNQDWTSHVKLLHEQVGRLKLRVVIGMRAALHGALMLAAGISREETEDACIWRPISVDDKAKILANMPKPVAPVVSADEPEIYKKAEHHIESDYVRCPKCQGEVKNNVQFNRTQQASNRKPIPDFKCLQVVICKWKVWPKGYDWKAQRWTTS